MWWKMKSSSSTCRDNWNDKMSLSYFLQSADNDERARKYQADFLSYQESHAHTNQEVRWEKYCQVSNISRTLVGDKIVDHSDVVGASPVGAAPTTSSFSTEHLASLDWGKTTTRWDRKHLSLVIWCAAIKDFLRWEFTWRYQLVIPEKIEF